METATLPTKVITKQIPRIVPYLDPTFDNMGLTAQGLALFEGSEQGEQLACLEQNGIKRWLTGLNEFSPEILRERDPELRAAKIKDIREKVIFIERMIGANDIAIDDANFWDKVKTVHPSNHDFWSRIFLKLTNDVSFLDPEDPNKLILICCIEAGGFSTVGKSYEDAKNSPYKPKWYLDKAETTAGTKTEISKARNEAGALLQKLFSSDQRKLFYVVKNVDTNSYKYKNATPLDVIYEYLDAFIGGQGSIKSVKTASKTFVDFCKMPLEDLKLKAVIADASFSKVIYTKADGHVYHARTDSMMGKNAAEILIYMKNPLNTTVTEAILKDIEKQWEN